MTMTINLNDYGVTEGRGFLPQEDPVQELPRRFRHIEDTMARMPELLAAGRWGESFERLQIPNMASLTYRELQRLHMLLSFALSAYVWERWRENIARTFIHAKFTVPYVHLSGTLGLKPILAYAGYGLWNWKRIDPEGPIACGNLALLQAFWGGLDEAGFILPHVMIEAQAGPVIAAAIRAQEAAMLDRPDVCGREMIKAANAFEKLNATFTRMPDDCEPKVIYRNRVRPWIMGWYKNDLMPVGVVYDGCFGGQPQAFRGETGAESSFFRILDAVFGVQHDMTSDLSKHLIDLLDYMPPKHRALIKAVEARQAPLDIFVANNMSLRDAYNLCIHEMVVFRTRHLGYAKAYIHDQPATQGGKANPRDTGTGGSPYMKSLEDHRDRTAAKILI